MSAIETMFEEERRYPPPPDFAEQANAQPGIYDEDFGFLPTNSSMKPVHVANGLARRLVGFSTDHMPLARVLRQYGFEGVLVGDEGGFGPRLQSNELAVRMILEAIENARTGKEKREAA